jgi:transcription initiation factor TFIIIB Brf1 subunit/transcription initiation factor TFIIB
MGEILSYCKIPFEEELHTYSKHMHNFIKDIPSGQIVCNTCGLVREMKLISMNWSISRDVNVKNNSNRKTNSSNISNLNLKRALKLDRNKTWKSQKIDIGTKEIKRLVAHYGLSGHVFERSEYLFLKTTKMNSFRIHNVRLTAQVCFFYAAKINSHPIDLEEIIKEFDFSSKLAYRYYYLLMNELALPKPIINPAPMIPQLCSKLELGISTVKKAFKILHLYLEQCNTSGLNSIGIVAGVVYLACLQERIPRSQQQVAKKANISDITLRSRYKEIKKICRRHALF